MENNQMSLTLRLDIFDVPTRCPSSIYEGCFGLNVKYRDGISPI
jgi:hypothetical protein